MSTNTTPVSTSTTTTNTLTGLGSAPDTTSCVIQPTSDQQMNANFASFVKLIIQALQDGSIPVKNSTRLQNLTVDDILALAKKNTPVQDIKNYITQNGTNVVEMIQSYNITKDTKFVTSGFINFKVITRREPDPSDPTGVKQRDIPYIQAKLPYDIINRDRIVSIHLTTRDLNSEISPSTKDDTINNTISNDVIFNYTLDIDSTDPKAAYIFEARAKKLNLGQTQVYDVQTYPNDKTKWGTWGIEKYIQVVYLVDTNWIEVPQEPLPDITVPNVAMTTSSPVIPMTYSLTNQPIGDPTSKPQESVNISFDTVRITSQADKKETITLPDSSNVINDPKWILIEDATIAKQFDSYTRWLGTANRVLEQKTGTFTWSPDSEQIGLIENVNMFIMPNNKIINQFTYNMVKEEYINWGKTVGISSKIIEMTSVGSIHFDYVSTKQKYDTITGKETEYGLLIKLAAGEQYPFMSFQVNYIPARIIEALTYNLTYNHSIINVNIPTKLIEEITTYLNPLRFNGMASYLPIPQRIINFLVSTDINYPILVNNISTKTNIIEERAEAKNFKNTINMDTEFIKLGTRIINENLQLLQKIQSDKNYKPVMNVARVINQFDPSLNIQANLIDIFNATEELNVLEKIKNIRQIQLGKLFIFKPSWIVNQESLYPMKMEVSSGSVYYIQDLYNMKVVSSLATEEMIPLVTAEGRQQRSEYEFIAEQDQRVFTVQHTPDLVTVFRQGFKLSHGDFYSNGYKIILKSPANAGEIINIVSEKRYVFSNTVSKEELNNALEQFKTNRPIITYPGIVYENSTCEIKIQNYDPSAVYTVSIKFEGTYRDDILWTKRNDTIVVDIPEITNVATRVLSVVIYSNTMGKLQSLPTEASIHIKNLFDVDTTTNGQDYKRLVFGAVPTEWYGMSNLVYTFDSEKTTLSNYSALNALTRANGSPYDVPARIGIKQNNWYQTKLIDSSTDKKFSGTYLNAYFGLENIVNIQLDIISSNGDETVFGSDYTQTEIENAFTNGTLYFIVDASTASNDANYQVPNGPSFGKHKYSYRPALEYTNQINILPRTNAIAATNSNPAVKATYYLEHNNKLRGRNIHAAIILDFEFLTDFDFSGFASLNETTGEITQTFPLEHIEYKVQDEIPFLMGTLNDPRIPHLTNPYVNIGSKVAILTGNATLDANQKDNLVVNNIYAEKIFSGLHTDQSSKDNFIDTKAIMNKSKYYKKFYPFSYGTIYETDYKKDFFMLNEEDVSDPSLNTKTVLSMARFYSDLDFATDNPTYSTRLKELVQSPTTSDSFKAVYAIPSEDYSAGSLYQANIAILQYGGSADYVIDSTGKTSNLIEQKISIQKVYIKNSETIISGQVPASSSLVKDGYHVMTGNANTKRIPTWWDVVLRPSVRASRQDSLRDTWYLIRDNVTLSDPRWLKITDGILRKPKVVQDTNLNGMIHRDFEILNIPDQAQIFLMGGEGYRPTLKRMEAVSVTQDYLNSITPGYGAPTNPGKYFVNEAKWAYYHRDQDRGHNETRTVVGTDGKPHTTQVWIDDHGWKGQTEIMKIDYGWENGEPYVEFVWGSYYSWHDWGGSYTGIKLYRDRVSREKCVNSGIYHIDLSKLDKYNPGDNDIFPTYITKIYNEDYAAIYRNEASTTERITDLANLGTGLVAPYKDRPNFIDTVYESGAWWLTIRQAYSKDTKLFRMKSTWALSGSTSGGIDVTTFTFEQVKNLNYNNGSPGVAPTRENTNYSKWSLIPDITGMLRGDGPILIKHKEQTPLLSPEATTNPGIYYYDTWDGYMYKKADNDIPITSFLFGLKEVMGIRNPYIIQFDPFLNIEDKIDIVGSRFFVIMYLDKYLSTLTKDQFLQWKEEIFHIDAGVSTGNPTKLITIYPNSSGLKVRAIIPDGDDYRANSAQVVMERITTQTGRPASNFVFRLTNKSSRMLEIDSIRFTTT